jgi:hypothetical protein
MVQRHDTIRYDTRTRVPVLVKQRGNEKQTEAQEEKEEKEYATLQTNNECECTNAIDHDR